MVNSALIRIGLNRSPTVIRRSGQPKLDDLLDVIVPNPADDDILYFQYSSNTWVSKSPAANVNIGNVNVDAGTY